MKIKLLKDGPLLITGLNKLSNGTGSLQAQEKTALCRCGGSSTKPFCDGKHVGLGFSTAKQDDRTADRIDDFAGKELTVHDNRGICAHAGICTRELPSVWRMGEEPWIDPDGANPEEIIALIQRCPSGALGYTKAAHKAGTEQDEPAIHIAKNGPYAVSGASELIGAELGQGVSSGRYTLCRCGGSRNKPFCDGAHWGLDFQDDNN